MGIQVAVCGPGECGDHERRSAFEVGRLAAERGAVVICGGYGGVMAAAAAGARSADGTVVGVLPRADRDGANSDLSIAIPTGIGQARNAVIVNSGDAVIVIGGGWGTLSELAQTATEPTPICPSRSPPASARPATPSSSTPATP